MPGMPIAPTGRMQSVESRIRVKRWPTERPLFFLNAVASACIWALLARALPSLSYVAALIALMALMNLGLIAYIRGSAVRLGADQFADLYARVEELARRMGLRRMPEVYLQQQDGALNAFATRFLRSHIVVVLTDLLEACGDNRAARDMIIGHELGHIRAGHLLGRWLLLPASFVPFLGSALSRAREYTCDRYGFAAAGDRDGALLGLTILAVGGKYGPLVNKGAFARQRADLRRSSMLVGEWLASHPPLSRRLAAIAPDLELEPVHPVRGVLRWLRPFVAATAVVLIGVTALYAYLPQLGISTATPAQPRPPDAAQQVGRDLGRLRALVESERHSGRPLPWDVWELYARWDEAHLSEPGPVDPFSGYWYDYDWRGGDAYRIWSVGQDGRNRTKDDIVFDSRSAIPEG
jgi:Zn-dependent protease with chaperone function